MHHGRRGIGSQDGEVGVLANLGRKFVVASQWRYGQRMKYNSWHVTKQAKAAATTNHGTETRGTYLLYY